MVEQYMQRAGLFRTSMQSSQQVRSLKIAAVTGGVSATEANRAA